MPTPRKPSSPVAGPGPRKSVVYARVSSKEQEKEGFSIPAQLKLETSKDLGEGGVI